MSVLNRESGVGELGRGNGWFGVGWGAIESS